MSETVMLWDRVRWYRSTDKKIGEGIVIDARERDGMVRVELADRSMPRIWVRSIVERNGRPFGGAAPINRTVVLRDPYFQVEEWP